MGARPTVADTAAITHAMRLGPLPRTSTCMADFTILKSGCIVYQSDVYCKEKPNER